MNIFYLACGVFLASQVAFLLICRKTPTTVPLQGLFSGLVHTSSMFSLRSWSVTSFIRFFWRVMSGNWNRKKEQVKQLIFADGICQRWNQFNDKMPANEGTVRIVLRTLLVLTDTVMSEGLQAVRQAKLHCGFELYVFWNLDFANMEDLSMRCLFGPNSNLFSFLLSCYLGKESIWSLLFTDHS